MLTVMSERSVPQTRSLCSTCEVAWAWLGERECGDCLFVTRLERWLLAEHPVPHEPTPWGMSVDEALEWATAGVIHPEPRIREVAAPSGRGEVATPSVPPGYKPAGATELVVRQVMVWAGLVLLIVFASGWLFGRLGC